MLRPTRLSEVAGLLVIVTVLATPSSMEASAPNEALARELRMAVEVHPRGEHLHRLFGLRQLRDPALRPLFLHVAHSDDWAAQVHGMLGLLELAAPADDQPIDAELLRDVLSERHPLAQEAVIANALDRRLIRPANLADERIEAVLAPPARLLAMAETGRFDAALLVTLSVEESDHVAVLAMLLRMESGEAAAIDALRSRVGPAAGGRAGHRLSLWTLDAVRQFRMVEALPFVRELLERDDLPLDVCVQAIRALGVIAPAEVTPPLRTLLERRASLAHRIRGAMLALELREHAPADTWPLFPDTDRIISTMRQSGEALMAGTLPIDAYAPLIDLDHPMITRWLIAQSSELPRDQARDILANIVDRMLAEPGRSPLDATLEAVDVLAQIDVTRITDRLRAAADDTTQQELLLLGLMNHHDEAIGRTVAGIRRVGLGRPDALTLLLHARFVDDLSPDDARRLEWIAAGGANLSPGSRAQAAWLLLHHRGHTADALRAVLPADLAAISPNPLRERLP